MIETTKYLVDKTDARVGYVQSDEISLLWMKKSPESQIIFDGRLLKLTSVLAGMASAFFNKEFAAISVEFANKFPHFDCRVFNLPTEQDVVDTFVWRQEDCVRNAIMSLAQKHFSHNELQGVSTAEQRRMLVKADIDINEYPERFRTGTFVKRILVKRPLTKKERLRIPLAHRPKSGALFDRHETVKFFAPRLAKTINAVGVLFNGEEPHYEENS
jgi:tRNA(His) 5'-end guanylyltransferase